MLEYAFTLPVADVFDDDMKTQIVYQMLYPMKHKLYFRAVAPEALDEYPKIRKMLLLEFPTW